MKSIFNLYDFRRKSGDGDGLGFSIYHGKIIINMAFFGGQKIKKERGIALVK